MPAALATRRSRLAARDVLLVALSCLAALELFYWALGQWAALHMWDGWIIAYPTAGAIVPFATVALSSGFIVGIVVSVLIPPTAVRITMWAAFVACVLSSAAALVAGGFAWAVGAYTVLVGP